MRAISFTSLTPQLLFRSLLKTIMEYGFRTYLYGRGPSYSGFEAPCPMWYILSEVKSYTSYTMAHLNAACDASLAYDVFVLLSYIHVGMSPVWMAFAASAS